jgi:hypothetical protein
MAEPNYNLLNTATPAQAALAPIQGAQQANAFISQALQNKAVNMEIQNALAEQEAYKQAAQGQGSVQQNLLGAGLGGKAAAYGKSIAEAQKLGTEGQLKAIELQRERNANLRFNPSNENVIAHLQDSIIRKEITPEAAQQMWEKIAGMDEQQRVNYFTQMGMSAEKAQSLLLRQQESDTSRKRLEFEMSPTEQARIAQAKATGTETGKTGAQAAANLPAAVQTANEAIALIDEMVGKAPVIKDGKVIEKGTAPHPGFSSYVGATLFPGARFVEGTDAASYELRQKQIEGQAFLEAFRSLKGGGSITEKEGEKATAAITRMNKAASEKEYVTAARELQGILREGVKRAQAKAARGTIGGGGPLPKNRWADELATFEAQENQ